MSQRKPYDIIDGAFYFDVIRRQRQFWARVDKTSSETGCWTWLGCPDVGGYGHFYISGRGFFAHRFAYELLIGPIESEVLDHACSNPICVRPDPKHVRPASYKQNAENLSRYSSRNETGLRGVYMVGKRYGTRVRHNGKCYSAGVFDTLNEAGAAIIAKRNELYTHNDDDRRVISLD